MRRSMLGSVLGFAFAASTACGGAGDAPLAQPESVAKTAAPDAGSSRPGSPVEAAPASADEPAAQPEVPPAATPEPAPAETTPAYAGKGPERPVLGSDKGAQGSTEFPHWAHQRAEIKCASCHHAGSGGKSCGKGADCHQATEVNAPSAKDAFHAACRPCHKKKGFSSGCDFCHKPKAG
jgi:hypothetical protein